MSTQEIAQQMKRNIGLHGIISLIIGLLIFLLPGKVAQMGTFLISISFLIIGFSYLLNMKKNSQMKGITELSHLILAVIYIIAGLFMALNLAKVTTALFIVVGIVVGFTWLIDGVVSIALSRYTAIKKGLQI